MPVDSATIDRRRFILGSGGVIAAPVLLGGDPAAASAAPAGDAMPTDLAAQSCDLTLRWRHLEARVVRDGLVAAWPMDEGTGYVFDDVSGRGHDFHITGSRWNTTDSGLVDAFRRPGRRGGGVFLDGTRWLQAQQASDLDLNGAPAGMTLTAWVRPTEGPGERATLLSYGDAYALTLASDGALRFTVRRHDGEYRSVESDPLAVPPGRWTHVAAVTWPGASRLTLTVDGRTVRRFAVPASIRTPATDDLVAGVALHGQLDELTLHDRALDPDEVRGLYLVGLPRVYTQSRETIDADSREWTSFRGSDPIPHPVEADTVLAVRFDGDTGPVHGRGRVADESAGLEPGHFGGALRATGGTGVAYESPLGAPSGTCEVWYQTVVDDADPDRSERKELVRAEGDRCGLALYTEAGRWHATLRIAGAAARTVSGPAQTFVPGQLEHVAVAWGPHGGQDALSLHVNGVEVSREPIDLAGRVFDRHVVVGGSRTAPAYCLVDDLRLSDRVRTWGEICPRGHAATDAAGLDLRDGFDRAPGTAPRWWRPASGGAAWSHERKTWEDPSRTGDAPERATALLQREVAGLHPIHHPDAYGHASSIEAGVSFAAVADGWAGVFVQASAPEEPFSGHTFAVNPGRGQLRIARYAAGAPVEAKTLPYDFPTRAATTYELTLTATGDGLLRGFVDGHNLITMRVGDGAPASGHAGLFTHDAAAFFDDVHVTALTPARPASRLVQLRLFTTGGEVEARGVRLEPFRWHKRRGLPPWQYTRQGEEFPGDPELPGNLAGADTPTPERPIPPAFWRSEDSANSELVTIDGRVVFFMRGNPRVGGRSIGARIGVLETTVDTFDGIHFQDPSAGITDLDDCKLLQGPVDESPEEMRHQERFQLNDEGCAYVGDGRLLLFAKEFRNKVGDFPSYRRLIYGYYDVRADDWVDGESRYVDWSAMDPGDPEAVFQGIEGTPELVSLRDPDTDDYRVLLYHQATTGDDRRVMGITGLRLAGDGVPVLDPEHPTVHSIGRPSNKVVYSFRVLFDNGIYYLHYAEGPQTPDWPDYFVLGAALDPYGGPWIVNEDTNADDATYFRHGERYEPDNAAIWQGTMLKLRGRYYMYYENYHAIGTNLDQQYSNYNHPQAGSRVGYATA
ncbi:LamG domain-containing protein [Jiangella asiatica]|uniref:LamG-like jellyroll fold domain-containing protein n=1 Tax=Jiangella asiatica TaxID=2530372 RepID=A0A4R5DPY1_9ACTN|nr:LamG domain-containing protein [Jiangella asiatica]TDE14274.1 hypothetical protein E1269_03720 [Jiangella asiatica]